MGEKGERQQSLWSDCWVFVDSESEEDKEVELMFHEMIISQKSEIGRIVGPWKFIVFRIWDKERPVKSTSIVQKLFDCKFESQKEPRAFKYLCYKMC